ncbi:tripartite tricarboxylate transporter TctB family protein [Gudongella sp. DL1XJH-153]|uniref:tripartite tricarboxylate transporter TctB family protein n=1 Tax=Gudongella sp. DL1XJH-153 TaxID=3409804 RepID=UPI003BB4BE7A
MKKKIHHDIYVGLFMGLISLLGYMRTAVMPTGADLFPKILFGLFGFFSLFILIKGIAKSKILTSENRKDIITLSGLKWPLAALLIITAYTILLRYLGFFVSTIIYIPSFMFFYRYKKIPIMLVSVIGMMIFVYLVFVKQLNVQFPKGILF